MERGNWSEMQAASARIGSRAAAEARREPATRIRDRQILRAFAGAVSRFHSNRGGTRLLLALLISVLTLAVAGRANAAPPIPPTNLDRPDYDYSNANSCPACHFIEGYDHTARAAGIQWNDTTQQWDRTGHGWWDSAHSQSQFGWSSTAINYGWVQPPGPYGETDNTFCTYCHSPLQAGPASPLQFYNGALVGASPVPTFMAVTCSACHPSNVVAGEIVKEYPTALSGGELGTLIRGDDPNQASSWLPVLPGQENQFCLTCHEINPHQGNAVYQVMFDAGVTCFDCHMAPYQIFTGTASSPAAPLPERFHDWKVAENLPYSCGAQGSLSGFTCHSEFTAQSALAFIPVLTQQHSEWWSLPPFTGSSASQIADDAISAHNLSTAADYMNLWRQIQSVEGKGK